MKIPAGIKAYGDMTFRGNCPREAAEQATFFNRIRKTRWGAVALHPRNEGKFTPAQVARMKAEGMCTGASDIIIIAAVPFVCELKRLDHTKSSWQKGQIPFLEEAQIGGAFACVAFGCNAAWEAFLEWELLQTP